MTFPLYKKNGNGVPVRSRPTRTAAYTNCKFCRLSRYSRIQGNPNSAPPPYIGPRPTETVHHQKVLFGVFQPTVHVHERLHNLGIIHHLQKHDDTFSPLRSQSLHPSSIIDCLPSAEGYPIARGRHRRGLLPQWLK